MSYYAKCSGTIVLKDPKDKDIVLDIISKYQQDYQFEWENDDHPYPYISVSGYDDYKENNFCEMYAGIAPFVKSAEISFTAEDGDLWKQSFEDGVFVERQGEIVYGDPVEMYQPKEMEEER